MTMRACDNDNAAATDLVEVCRQFMPKGIALDNANVSDAEIIPLDVTMGELRRMSAAIGAAGEAADRLASGVALLKLIKGVEDVSTASALVQAALDFLTNDEAALAEGRRWAPGADRTSPSAAGAQ